MKVIPQAALQSDLFGMVSILQKGGIYEKEINNLGRAKLMTSPSDSGTL